MTATVYFHVMLRCNADSCTARFHGNPMEKRGAVRKRARAAGWHSVPGPRHRDDYCPRHPEEIQL
jgi:hypothetical protein